MKPSSVLPFAVWMLLPAAGCMKSYIKSGPSALPEYIHKIAIRPFTNHTQQFGLENVLTSDVQTEFIRDGRYQLTTEDQADGVVIGDVTKYLLEPLSYDTNHVPTEYKLSMPVDVSFYDKVKDKNLWSEPGMTAELRYFVSTSGFAGSMTEVEAQQTIWDQLARDIVQRTLVPGYAGKSGHSESDNSHLAPLNDNPPPVPSEEPSAPSPTQQPY